MHAFRLSYLETSHPFLQSLHGRRSLVRWHHNQIFVAWWATKFSKFSREPSACGSFAVKNLQLAFENIAHTVYKLRNHLTYNEIVPEVEDFGDSW